MIQDTINENREIIDLAVNSEAFTDKINEAVPHKVRLDVDLKREIKEVRDMYSRQMINSDPKIKKIFEKKKKDRTEDEQVEIGTFIRNCEREFNAIKKIIFPIKDGDSKAAVYSLVSKIVNIAGMLKYIGRSDIEGAFYSGGIQLSIPKIEDKNPYFNDETVKDVIKDIFAQAEDVQKQVKENTDKIKDEIYNSLPDTVKYDGKMNKKGIKASQFQKLVKQKAIIVEKGDEAGMKFKDSQIKKTEEEIVAKQIEIEKAQQI